MRHTVRILAALLCLWPVFSLAARSEAVQVYVSIEPLQYLVEQVAGERVDVGVVVAAGQRPETYEPTPRQIGALAQADIFFGVGMPLEAAWRRQLRETASSRLQWIDLADGLPEQGDAHAGNDAHDHDDEEETRAADGHGHRDGMDPHVWLSPANAQQMVSVIARVLGRVDPEHADQYTENAGNLRVQLQALDREITGLLAESGVDSFLVYHPAWGYFARDYGLRQISIESEGKEPGPRGLVGVIRQAREAGIRTIFVDPRHSQGLAETVADAIGARLEVLDPLAYDYPDNLRRAARAIAASRS